MVSSANMKDRTNDALGKSFIYRRKRRGTRLDPWGTPYFINRILINDIGSVCYSMNTAVSVVM